MCLPTGEPVQEKTEKTPKLLGCLSLIEKSHPGSFPLGSLNPPNSTRCSYREERKPRGSSFPGFSFEAGIRTRSGSMASMDVTLLIPCFPTAATA